MLGPVHPPGEVGKSDSSKEHPFISEVDRIMLDKLALPSEGPRLRSRFMSVSKGRRLRKQLCKRSLEADLLVDEFYRSPAKLLLRQIGDWTFNIFSLENLSADRSLFHVSYHLFKIYDFIKHFRLDAVRLIHFLSLVEQNYHETNPYHNAVHAADVTQTMHCFLQETEICESTSSLEKMASLVAALAHDIDHPGVNNTFLIVTSNHLATLYENLSVLENHHWRSAVGLLQESGLLQDMPAPDREKFTNLMKALILATDITRQQEFLVRFNRFVESEEFQFQENEDHRHFLLQIALKCADISNPCRPWKICKQWSTRICREFFLQGDLERTLNVAVTPLCDRNGNTVANIQHGFIQFVVSPLFKVWDKFLGTQLSAKMLSNLHQNQSKWKSIKDSGPDMSDLETDILDDLDRDDVHIKNPRPESKSKEADEMRTELAESSSQQSNLDNNQPPFVPHEEEEEIQNEQDDIVENDVNLLYHYQTELDETGRCLSPVSEDSEHFIMTTGNVRRFSAPYIRKDLSFYLGLRKDLNLIPGHILRRQSLPTTIMYVHNSSSGSSSISGNSPRSLSMDALLFRPKISNLSTSLDMGFPGGPLDPPSFPPLKTQILMLQGGSLTRFISSTNFRRASVDHVTHELLKGSGSSSDSALPSYKTVRPHPLPHQSTGVPSSWPTVARRNTTNGSIRSLPSATPSPSSSSSADQSSAGQPLEEGTCSSSSETSTQEQH